MSLQTMKIKPKKANWQLSAKRRSFFKITPFLLSIFYFLFSTAFAGVAGTSAGSFLKVGAGAKHAAMGDASGGTSNDAVSTYWNPAGLVRLNHGEVNLSHGLWLQDTSFSFVAAAFPLGWYALGVNLAYLQYGTINGRDNQDNLTGDFTANSKYGSLSFACFLNETTSAGVTVKKVMEKITTVQASAFTVDIGGIYRNEDVKIGLTVKNMGQKIGFAKEKHPLPQETRLSLSQSLFYGQLKLYGDATSQNDTGSDFGLGLELNIFESFPIRAGWRKNRASHHGNLAGFTFGFGAHMNSEDINSAPSVQIDYAFVPYNDLGYAHRVSLTIPFSVRTW